jgi:hypothetical protein
VESPAAPTAASEPPPDAERERVAAALERVRAGVRQRQGELATGPGTHQQVRMRLLELKAHEFVQQPVAFSPRPVVGTLLVLTRKVLFKAFMKWYLHPVLQQQNRYNQVSSQLLQELAETNDQLRRRVAALEERLRELDAAPAEPPPPAAAPGDGEP